MKTLSPIALLFFILSFSTSPALQAAVSPEQRDAEIQAKKEAILIKAKQQLEAQESQEKPIEEIKERTTEIPEVPQPLKERELGPAEKTQLQTLEQKHDTGETTDTEHKLEKDALIRSSNIKF